MPARAGLLASRDGGPSWADGPAVGVNSQLVLAPGGQRAYLVGPRGLFRGLDGLRSQERAMSSMHDIEIFAIAADARWPGLLYAATPVGLYRSAICCTRVAMAERVGHSSCSTCPCNR